MTGSTTTGWMSPLAGWSWTDIAGLNMDGWLWLDTVGAGVHVEDRLGARPVHVTHLWGWSPTQRVRCRLDPDLPGEGIVGALLDLVSERPEPGGTAVTVLCRPTEAWDAADSAGRISAVLPRSVAGGARLTVLEVRHGSVGGADREREAITWSVPLTFLSVAGVS